MNLSAGQAISYILQNKIKYTAAKPVYIGKCPIYSADTIPRQAGSHTPQHYTQYITKAYKTWYEIQEKYNMNNFLFVTQIRLA